MGSRGLVIRGFLVGALVASALLLAGCSAPTQPPAPPSPAEIAAARQRAVDLQWEATGLEGIVPRPEVTAGQLIADTESGDLGTCVTAAGIASWFTAGNGLMLSDGTRGSDEQQLAYYSCFARFPEVVVFSEAQRDFIYDYYARTYIPCLGLHGYPPEEVPTRDSFVSAESDFGPGWLWSPDSAFTTSPESQEEWERLYRACPPTRPGIEGWSFDMVFSS